MADVFPSEKRCEIMGKIKKPGQMSRLQCDLDGIRTHDPLIKSQVLYRLSYEIEPDFSILQIQKY